MRVTANGSSPDRAGNELSHCAAGRASRSTVQRKRKVKIPDSPAVRSADQEETLPVASDEKRPLSIARRRRGSGGPPGKRNGQYRHGERTKAAIAERQKFSALLKKLRARLT
jgi:hypothetical protein